MDCACWLVQTRPGGSPEVMGRGMEKKKDSIAAKKMPELNKIYLGDCLEIMKTWPDKCLDMVFTSPPYNIFEKRNDVSNRPLCNKISSGWYDDSMPEDTYIQWQKNVLNRDFSTSGRGKKWVSDLNYTQRCWMGLLDNGY